MKKWLWLLSLLPSIAFAANPSLGIHNISANLGGTASYTSPTGYTSQSSGSSFAAFIVTLSSESLTVSDTYNSSANWSKITLGSGSNPTEQPVSGTYIYAFVCAACSGGVNDELTVSTAGGDIYYVDYIESENSSTVDVSAGASSSSGSMLSLSITPTVSNDLVLASLLSGNGATTTGPTGSGWTTLDTSGGLGSGYLSNAAASAQNALMQANMSGTGLAGIDIAFKGSGGSGPPKSQMFMAHLWQRPVSLEAMAH